jgi:hypothetical protein
MPPMRRARAPAQKREMTDPNPPPEKRQAGVYAAVTRACLSVPACQGVTV